MKQNNFLSSLTKEELIKLIEAYSKNWLAMDGVWFQSIERKFGMDEAMHHDREAWKSFTITEARRIKQFLGLPEHAGLEGLAKALELRFYANINNDEIILGKDNKTLVYRTLECHVQTARKRNVNSSKNQINKKSDAINTSDFLISILATSLSVIPSPILGTNAEYAISATNRTTSTTHIIFLIFIGILQNR